MSTERTFVRCDSHRARDRVERLVGRENITPWFVWAKKGRLGATHGVEVPPERLDECLTIKSVRRWHPDLDELHRPW